MKCPNCNNRTAELGRAWCRECLDSKIAYLHGRSLYGVEGGEKVDDQGFVQYIEVVKFVPTKGADTPIREREAGVFRSIVSSRLPTRR